MTTTASRPAPPTHVLETCLYVRSMDVSVAFFRDVLGLKPDVQSARLTTFPIGITTLILFQLGLTEADFASIEESTGEKLTIPGHGPDQVILDAIKKDSRGEAASGNPNVGYSNVSLRAHFCLAVPTVDDVEKFEVYLREQGAIIRGVMHWERGGRSVYFEDPDGNIGEIGSRGIW